MLRLVLAFFVILSASANAADDEGCVNFTGQLDYRHACITKQAHQDFLKSCRNKSCGAVYEYDNSTDEQIAQCYDLFGDCGKTPDGCAWKNSAALSKCIAAIKFDAGSPLEVPDAY